MTVMFNACCRETIGLFDHSLGECEERCRAGLVGLAGQLAQLVTVLSALAAEGPATQAGQGSLECRLNIAGQSSVTVEY